MSARRADDEPLSQNERELELKYSVTDLEAVRRLVSADQLGGYETGPWREREVVDQYVDTHTGSLARAGYGARLRHADRRTLVTIKSAAIGLGHGRGHEALHDRLELEGRANRQLNPRRWPETAARSLIEATTAGEPLRTLFHLDQRREERDLIGDEGVVAKVSIDCATIRRFGRPMGEFAMLEIEAATPLTANSRKVLTSIATALEQVPELTPERRSKEQLALRVLSRGLAARASRPPRHPGITADEPLSEAGRKVLRMHLLRMLAAEPGARAGEDIEAVHKMRVATRRMRAAWRVFDGAYRPRLQRRYVDELRGVARALGGVRDIDVQLERLAAYRAGLDEAAAASLEPLVADWQRRRGDARRDLLDLLGSGAHDRFITDYRAFVETPGAGAQEGSTARVRDVAAGRIWRAYEILRAHDAILPWADVPALHALRIDGKRLRYALEFFGEILPATAGRVIADVTALQDHLGLLNDAQIAVDTTRTWLLDNIASLSQAERQAAGEYLEASEADVTRLRKSFRPLWRHLVGPSFRRRLALVVGSI